MNISKAASRYAKALLDLATEKQVQDQVLADMTQLAEALAESRELRMLVASKVVNEEKKEAALEVIFKGKLQDITLLFFKLLAKNSRADLIPDITHAYPRAYKIANGILEIEVRTAQELDDASLEKIKQLVISDDWKTVEVNEVIDPAVIGGFVVKGNNTVYDASVASQLRTFKHNLVDYSHIAQL